MNIVLDVLATPLGWVLYFMFLLTNSFGMSIIFFAIITKLILFPLTRFAHLNSIRLLKLQPALSAIQKRYAHDKERLNEERYGLFTKEKYSPLVGIVPLLVQLVLLMGMLQVMYDPLYHMGFPEGIDLYFLGVDLREGSFIMPFFSGVAALIFALTQNFISPGALSQGKKMNVGLIIFTVGLSIYFAAVTPAGVGLYWTVGNLFAVVIVVVLYLFYNPYTLASEALALQNAERKTPAEIQVAYKKDKENKAREKADATRFLSAKKQLVFYAISGGQYKYYKNIIDYLLTHSDMVIHYLTSDSDDSVFHKNHPKLLPYYAGQGKVISLMLKLDADMFVTTVPDLQTFHVKRSIVRDNIEYIHTFHGLTSTHLVYKEKAFDYFDTILCVGPHQVAELRHREAMEGLPKKNLVKAGYGLYDDLLESYAELVKQARKSEKPRILIAPSWQADNLLDMCIDPMLESLIGNGYEIIVRPHPQHIRLFPHFINSLVERYMRYSETGEIIFELDFAGNESIFTSDVLITDWSGIAYEFSYCTLKPCIFINTPIKAMNPNYQRYGIEPLDIILRDKIGTSINVENVDKLNVAVSQLLKDKDAYKNQIEDIVKQYLYYPKRNGQAAGTYIMKKLGILPHKE
ncbi:MAG: membrane protein insertase YidC [Defluviitaleaceae bacterium]|nr:membrane protein insertase YidC [Defluviitaleaceae bacterium]